MRQSTHTLQIQSFGGTISNITSSISDWVNQESFEQGLLTIFIQHTSASLIIQENADPDVLHDIEEFFLKLVPRDPSLYRHTQEGSDDMPAHLRSILTQTHLSIPINHGAMALGTWQGIYLYEHRDLSQRRTINLHLIGD
jgi:secondary thiamine-phosphate synthase enzyme